MERDITVSTDDDYIYHILPGLDLSAATSLQFQVRAPLHPPRAGSEAETPHVQVKAQNDAHILLVVGALPSPPPTESYPSEASGKRTDPAPAELSPRAGALGRGPILCLRTDCTAHPAPRRSVWRDAGPSWRPIPYPLC